MKYFVVSEDYDETNAYIGNLPNNLERQYELIKGVFRSADWPDDIAFIFSKNRPEGMNLNDYVRNKYGWLIISERFKLILEKFNVENIEYLPIQINNHKGRLASKDYWIANFIKLTKAVDRESSTFEASPLDESKVFSFDKLVLTDEVEKAGPLIFRMDEEPMMILVREDLVSRIKEEGLTGMKFTETKDFKTYNV